MSAFLGICFVYIASWSVMFYSQGRWSSLIRRSLIRADDNGCAAVYRWTWIQWPFFASMTVASFMIFVTAAVFAAICLLNFNQGLAHYRTSISHVPPFYPFATLLAHLLSPIVCVIHIDLSFLYSPCRKGSFLIRLRSRSVLQQPRRRDSRKVLFRPPSSGPPQSQARRHHRHHEHCGHRHEGTQQIAVHQGRKLGICWSPWC